MANATETREPEITLGNPTVPVGHTAFLKHMGGGKCTECDSYASALMPDGKCARCSGVCDCPTPKPDTTTAADSKK